MSEDRISRKDLWVKLDQIKRARTWEIACERLAEKGYHIYFSKTGGKGSHGVIRDSEYPADNIRSLISTVQKKLYKKINQRIFKQLIVFGIKEDDIWGAMGM